MAVISFTDDAVNEMHRSGVDNDEQRRVARWAGYGDDWWLYTLHHDVTHCWLADAVGWPHSLALHDPEAAPIGEAGEQMQWEEHCVNRFQRLVQTGETDEYGCLQRQFGEALEAKVAELRRVLGVVSLAFG
jgi:hypothetical protein